MPRKNDISKRTHRLNAPESGLGKRKPLRTLHLRRPATFFNFLGGPCPPPNEPKSHRLSAVFKRQPSRGRLGYKLGGGRATVAIWRPRMWQP